MSEILIKTLLLSLVFIFLVYVITNLQQLWADKAYENSLQKKIRDAKQWGYDEAVSHLERRYAHSLNEIKKDISKNLLKAYGDSAEFVFEKDHSICMNTGEVTKARYFKYKPTYIKLAIKPTKDFVAKMDYSMEMGSLND